MIELKKAGKPIFEIALETGVSYSCVQRHTKGIKKGNVVRERHSFRLWDWEKEKVKEFLALLRKKK
jgi:predicted transcriptional regulator